MQATNTDGIETHQHHHTKYQHIQNIISILKDRINNPCKIN